MRHFQFSSKGSKRSKNEDSFLSLPGKGFFLVVDGVGKSAGAADNVVEVFSDLVTHSASLNSASSSSQGSISNGSSLLKEGLLRANSKLVERSRDEGLPCCAAALAVHITNGVLTAGWCGDCRLYRVNSSGKIDQLTTDHTRLAELVKRGVVSVDEIDSSMRKSALTKTLGDKDEVDCEFLSDIKIAAGERLFLCTDGVSDHLSDSDLRAFLIDLLASEDTTKLEENCYEKLKLADDDHTAILIFIEEADERNSISSDIVDESIVQISSGLKGEIQSIAAQKSMVLAKKKKQSLKKFILSIPSMPRKQLLGEAAIAGSLFIAVFLSPKLIEIAGQRMEGISLEYFIVAAIVIYFVILKLRLKFRK